jgi:hypothetical protein
MGGTAVVRNEDKKQTYQVEITKKIGEAGG